MTQHGSVPVLGTGSHVFKSHYFELIQIKIMPRLSFGQLIIIIIFVILLFGDVSKVVSTVTKFIKKSNMLKRKKDVS